MRLFILLCVVGASTAIKYRFKEDRPENMYRQSDMEIDYGSRSGRYRQDGAEYDERGNRIQPKVYSYRPEDNYEEIPQQRYRRQNQAYKYQKSSSGRPIRPVQPKRRIRPVERSEVRESSNRQEYIFKPNQQRNLRPVYREPEQKYAPEYAPAYPEVERVERVRPDDVERVRPNVVEQSTDVLTERFYTEPTQKKVFERNAQLDQLEGESFQPAYTPYSAPQAAYNEPYTPPEQKSIEAAVASGAANYKGEAYDDAKRLSFQIHGQEGPHSYRFGYDTGIGYNRQFRYEERDQYGVLHGRYGYYDQEGKLQIVNYTADPEGGFHAEGEHVPKPAY